MSAIAARTLALFHRVGGRTMEMRDKIAFPKKKLCAENKNRSKVK